MFTLVGGICFGGGLYLMGAPFWFGIFAGCLYCALSEIYKNTGVNS